MIIQIINLVLVMIFVLSSLNCLRHLFFLVKVILRNNNKPMVEEDEEEIPDEKYILSDKSLLYLGISLSYIIGSLIMGIVLN